MSLSVYFIASTYKQLILLSVFVFISALSHGYRNVFLLEAERKPPYKAICSALSSYSAKFQLWKYSNFDILKRFPLKDVASFTTSANSEDKGETLTGNYLDLHVIVVRFILSK